MTLICIGVCNIHKSTASFLEDGVDTNDMNFNDQDEDDPGFDASNSDQIQSMQSHFTEIDNQEDSSDDSEKVLNSNNFVFVI